MLKLALRHGLKLTKVYKILSFKQSRWVKPYVDFNTEQRMKAQTKFDKDLFKLNLNASFGKHIENIMNRCDIRLITKWDGRYGLESLIAKPNFKRNVIFNENLVACEMHRLNVMMTKPTIVGAAILEISKCLMYEFHYDFIMKHFNEKNCKILYTDTDSFLYEFKGKDNDPYKFIRKHSDKFDTSDFAENNPFGIERLNNKVLGLMKDELSGEIIVEFIGLRAKMYVILTLIDNIIKRAKGVKKYVLDKKIVLDDFRRCLEEQRKFNEILLEKMKDELNDEKTEKIIGYFKDKKRIKLDKISRDNYKTYAKEQCTMTEEQSCMRSDKHTVYNITNNKKVLDPFDDKRYLIPGSNSTLAWGHKNIR